MKKYFAMILVAAICLSLCACGGRNRAYDDSKVAFEKIHEAYTLVETFGSDLYEAWRLGINELDEITGKGGYYTTTYDYEAGLAYFCGELDIDESWIAHGIASLYYGEDYETSIDVTDKAAVAKVYKTMMTNADSQFSTCVHIVTEAYDVSGKTQEIEELLDEAKVLMKDMSNKHSDYEHYPNLKGYFTNTLAFFDFCQNPIGSFEQVVETINNYRNEAREYYFDLNYIFED